MALTPFIAEKGLQTQITGSIASLAIAAPLSDGSRDAAAFTDASRIGLYWDRTGAAEKIGCVVMGAEALSIGPAGISTPELTVTTTVSLPAASVLLSTLADIATASLLGRSTASTGPVEVITVSTGLTIAGGTIAVAYGSTSTTACVGDDARLSDARAPTAHVLDSASHTISGKTAGQLLVATAATTYAFTTLSGDATLSGVGALTVANSAITLAKMADVATASVFYRKAGGTGAPEVQALATLKTDLGLTGTNSGDQTITLTGNVTGTGSGTFATTITANAVTNAMLAQVATATFQGRATASTGNVETLTGTQATTLLDAFTSGLKGLAPASGGGTTNFLRADGTWAAPSGGSGLSGLTLGRVPFAASATTLIDSAHMTFSVTNGFSVNRAGATSCEMVGFGSGNTTMTGTDNSIFGNGGGTLLTTGQLNTLVGSHAGPLLVAGESNIFLGPYSGDSTDPAASNRMVVGSGASAVTRVFFGNGETNASPLDLTINTTGGFGSDVAGASLRITGGAGTGSGAGGNIHFVTAKASASSSTPNSLVVRHSVLQDGGVDWTGIATSSAPAVSATNHGVLFYDSTAQKFRVSQNGSAFADLVTSSLGGTISTGQVAVGSGSNTVAGSASLAFGSNRLTLSNNAAAPAAAPTGTQFIVVGADSSIARHLIESYGTGVYSAFSGRSARGTAASPSALQANDEITHLSAWGYGTSAYSSAARGYVTIFSSENWTNTAQGTRIGFYTTALTTTTTSEKVRIWGDGSVQIGGTYSAPLGAGVLYVNGAITGRVVPLSYGATINTNAALGNVFDVTLGGNPTFAAPTNPVDGQKIMYRITQDGAGGRTATFSSAFSFSTAQPEQPLSIAPGAVDLVGFIYHLPSLKWQCAGYNMGF